MFLYDITAAVKRADLLADEGLTSKNCASSDTMHVAEPLVVFSR